MLLVTLKIVISLIGICLANSLNDTEALLKINLEKLVRETLSENLKDISSDCQYSIVQYVTDLLLMKPWAMQMYDAGAKMPSGVANGNFMDLGSFEECLNIENPNLNVTIMGKYCLSLLPYNMAKILEKFHWTKSSEILTMLKSSFTPTDYKLEIQLATCVPHTCLASEIQTLFHRMDFNVTFEEQFCQTKSSQPQLDSGAIAAFIFFGVILGLMIISTTYDIIIYYKAKKSPHKLLLAFSVLTNGKKIITIKENSSELSCLHGLRVISTLWIIVSHKFLVEVSLPKRSYRYELEWLERRSSMYIIGATVSVDTFFLMAGLVIAYGHMTLISRNGKFNLLIFYLHRYLRLTPVMAAVLIIHLTLIKFMGSGPLWQTLTQYLTEWCQNNWWKALLYVQNYENDDRWGICIPQTWYLSVDCQLFLLSPIILWPLGKRPKLGLLFVVFLTLSSIASCFAIAWIYELNYNIVGNLSFSRTKYKAYMWKYYLAIYSRAAPWLIGIIAGYFVFKLKNRTKKVTINKLLVLFLWPLSLVTLIVCVFGTYDLMFDEYGRLFNSLVIAFLRSVWAIGVGWIIFACAFGYGGPVNWFLSVPVFQVLSKLTYTVYLTHFVLLYVSSANMKTVPEATEMTEWFTVWGDIAFVTPIALLFTLAFESPVIAIEKFIFSKSTEKRNNKQVE